MTPEQQRAHDRRRARYPGRVMQTSAAWRIASRAFLAEPANRLCAYCGAAAATCVDHHRAHKGDYALFWDRTNWRPCCADCNRRKAIATEGAFGRPPTGKFVPRGPKGCDADGHPTSPLHPWNREQR